MTQIVGVESLNGAEIVGALRSAPIAREDAGLVRKALRAAGLPDDDVEADGVTLYVFEQDDGVVGYGGLEICGENALVRSIVVDPEKRNLGVGRRIVERLLTNAARQGVRRAFLLTTDAQAYFERLGFAVVDRKRAPPAILGTRQAAGLCPASAVLMAKALSA